MHDTNDGQSYVFHGKYVNIRDKTTTVKSTNQSQPGLTSNVTRLRSAPSSDPCGFARRKMDLGVDGLLPSLAVVAIIWYLLCAAKKGGTRSRSTKSKPQFSSAFAARNTGVPCQNEEAINLTPTLNISGSTPCVVFTCTVPCGGVLDALKCEL